MGQRQIADCFIANMNEAPLWCVEELAETSQTCVATVVRFAKKLEYSGYLEMRKALISAAKKHYNRGEHHLRHDRRGARSEGDQNLAGGKIVGPCRSSSLSAMRRARPSCPR